MKVLVSGHLPPPVGGITVFYQALLDSSLPEKIELKFIDTSTHQRELSAAGKATVANLIYALQDCWRFLRGLIQFRPAIAHIATAFGFSFLKHSICVVFARMMGCRVLLHPHCSFSKLYTEKSATWQAFFRWVVKRTDGLVVLSREWEEIGKILPDKKIFFLPNAIDLESYKSIAIERFAKPKTDGKVIVFYLGYLGKPKGTYDLLHAARIITGQRQDVFFDLVGDELEVGDRKQLQQVIKSARMEEHVRVHPAVFDQRKLNYFRDADIFVYPSYHEGMPMAVIEAMASGLPVIATRVGGLPDLVTHGENGILTLAGQPEQLAFALLEIIDDHEKRSAMQRKSFQVALENHDMEVLVDKLIEVYRSTLQ